MLAIVTGNQRVQTGISTMTALLIGYIVTESVTEWGIYVGKQLFTTFGNAS